MSFSQTERLLLLNQYKILESQSNDEDDVEYYQSCQKIVQYGYKKEYHRLFGGFSSDEFDETKAAFVYDVLTMFCALQSSYARLSRELKSEIDEDSISFHGFDANMEADYDLYSDFLIKDLQLFVNCGFNDEYQPVYAIQTYKPMLDRWINITGSAPGTRLTLDQIKGIVG